MFRYIYVLISICSSGCYRFGDPLNEEVDSLHSDDEDRLSRSRPEDDSDEFADDEGMSNQGDSSSQEYLDDSNYLEEEEDDDDDDDGEDNSYVSHRKYLPCNYLFCLNILCLLCVMCTWMQG